MTPTPRTDAATRGYIIPGLSPEPIQLTDPNTAKRIEIELIEAQRSAERWEASHKRAVANWTISERDLRDQLQVAKKERDRVGDNAAALEGLRAEGMTAILKVLGWEKRLSPSRGEDRWYAPDGHSYSAPPDLVEAVTSVVADLKSASDSLERYDERIREIGDKADEAGRERDRLSAELSEIKEYLWPNQTGMSNEHRNALVAIKAREELRVAELGRLKKERDEARKGPDHIADTGCL